MTFYRHGLKLVGHVRPNFIMTSVENEMDPKSCCLLVSVWWRGLCLQPRDKLN